MIQAPGTIMLRTLVAPWKKTNKLVLLAVVIESSRATLKTLVPAYATCIRAQIVYVYTVRCRRACHFYTNKEIRNQIDVRERWVTSTSHQQNSELAYQCWSSRFLYLGASHGSLIDNWTQIRNRSTDNCFPFYLFPGK
jgi:hypothetical protein